MNKFRKIHSNHCPGAETRSQKDPWKNHITNTSDTYFLAHDKPTFLHRLHFSLHGAWCPGVHMVAHCAPGLTAPLSADWRLLTVRSPVWAGRAAPHQPLPARPHYTQYKHQSVWQEKLEKKNIILPPTWTLWPNYMTVKMSTLFDVYWQALCRYWQNTGATDIDWATGTRPGRTGDQFINSDN